MVSGEGVEVRRKVDDGLAMIVVLNVSWNVCWKGGFGSLEGEMVYERLHCLVVSGSYLQEFRDADKRNCVFPDRLRKDYC